jgi:ribosome-binding protein aMBF1 (putative translation factor)
MKPKRCSLCGRKVKTLTDGIAMADVKVAMCPSCFLKLKNNVALRGQLLQATLPQYRESAQAKAYAEQYKAWRKARQDVYEVLGA